MQYFLFLLLSLCLYIGLRQPIFKFLLLKSILFRFFSNNFFLFLPKIFQQALLYFFQRTEKHLEDVD